MKELRRKMRVIGLLVVIAFVGLGMWFGMTVYTQGGVWASNAYNTRVIKSSASMGDIVDRDGVILATSTDAGERKYLANAQARSALSQTVGDQMGMSGTGIESFYSAELLNLSNSITDKLRALASGEKMKGSSIQITVDAELTAYISSIFPEGYDGAVCVINYATGEILAMVSKPDYDPAALTSRQQAGTVKDTAFLNRCLQGLYTPGSTFKIVTLASALANDSNVLSREFSCSGLWEYEGGSIVCAGNAAHGMLNLESAFVKSCNITFGKLSYQLGMQRLSGTAEQFGFNENFKFGDFIVYNSQFPMAAYNTSDLVWSGIGQGKVLITPLHMAMISGSVANGGIMMKPALVKRIETSLGVTTRRFEPQPYRTVMSTGVADIIAEYMYETVKSGTAARAAIKGYTVCGKTGSAETSDDKTKETNAWFTGFVLDKANPYAIAVVIEEGGAGSRMASELAAKALKAAIDMVE